MAAVFIHDRNGTKVWKGSESDKNAVSPNPGDEFYTTNTRKHYVCIDIGVWTLLHSTG